MYRRIIGPRLQEALTDSPVVLINGARQVGKTTLVQTISKEGPPRIYLTLDDASVLSAAKNDPAGFLAGFTGPVIIDEVQRAPELFPAIKAVVDRHRQPGRFLLTGSANVLLLPRLSESLAGRMEILTLWPLAQVEIGSISEISSASDFGINLIDRFFSQKALPSVLPEISRTDLIQRLLAGGYPEPLARTSEARRRAWFGSYLTTICSGTCEISQTSKG